MAVTDLRRADLEDLPSEEGLSNLSNSNLELEHWSRQPVEPLDEDYPFDQDSFTAQFTYYEPSEYTSGREIKLNLEYRLQSQLLLVELHTDLSLDPVFNELSHASGASDRIYHNLHAPEDQLWSFIMEADRTLDIHVLDDGNEVPYREVEDTPVQDVIGEYAIEYAQVGFVREGHEIAVTYESGRLQIETDWNDGREYILQVFEREVLTGQ